MTTLDEILPLAGGPSVDDEAGSFETLVGHSAADGAIGPVRSADGARRDEVWTVFWYGIDDWTVIRSAVESALARPATLLD